MIHEEVNFALSTYHLVRCDKDEFYAYEGVLKPIIYKRKLPFY